MLRPLDTEHQIAKLMYWCVSQECLFRLAVNIIIMLNDEP